MNTSNNTSNSLKKFFSTSVGRIVLSTILYVILFGIIYALAMTGATFIILFFAVAFTVFGWKALTKITPNIFLIMPVGGWIAYYIIKGSISFFIGLFVAPYVIGKSIAKKISGYCVQSVNETQKYNTENVTSYAETYQVIHNDFDKTMSEISLYSVEKLEEMHRVLLKYVQRGPVPIPNADYFAEVKEFDAKTIEDGPIYGCKTYGEAKQLNVKIVSILPDD